MKATIFTAIGLTTALVSAICQAATLKIETLPQDVSLMTAGLDGEKDKVGIKQGESYEQPLSRNITLSPVSAPDKSTFGMLSLIYDLNVPMTYVSCSGFNNVNFGYAAEITVGNEPPIFCKPTSPAKNAALKVNKTTSDVTIRFFKPEQ